MWVLRFDHGVTSAGFSLDPDEHPIRSSESPEAEWRRLVGAYPSLAKQFADAEALRPFVRTGRLQRRLTRAAGADWALLPHAAGFLDAWLSPGIARRYLPWSAGANPGENWRFKENEEPRELQRHVLRELAGMDQITGVVSPVSIALK